MSVEIYSKKRKIFAVGVLSFEYLYEMLVKHQPPRALRSASQNLLTELKTRKLYGERAFAFSGPYLWNKLPPHVRESESVAIFKTKLKTHLFSAAF